MISLRRPLHALAERPSSCRTGSDLADMPGTGDRSQPRHQHRGRHGRAGGDQSRCSRARPSASRARRLTQLRARASRRRRRDPRVRHDRAARISNLQAGRIDAVLGRRADPAGDDAEAGVPGRVLDGRPRLHRRHSRQRRRRRPCARRNEECARSSTRRSGRPPPTAPSSVSPRSCSAPT